MRDKITGGTSHDVPPIDRSFFDSALAYFNSNRRLLDHGPLAPVDELARTRTHIVFVGNVEIESCDAATT